MKTDIIDIIKEVAQIPSFSSFEERIHPFIYDFIKSNKIPCKVYKLYNNLIVEINDELLPTIAFTAHLDKINHFNEEIEKLPFNSEKESITGQLDNAVGIGICLYILKNFKELNIPHTLFLFSEMEESSGYIKHRHTLKNEGIGLHPQIGAKRIPTFLIENSIIPSLFLTIDTTPKFRGEPGIALYSKFWEISKRVPTTETLEKTVLIEQLIQSIYPDITLANNINDYIMYGEMFAANDLCIPSIAIEPSIFPYHTIGEKVFIADIVKTYEIIAEFVSVFAKNTNLHT